LGGMARFSINEKVLLQTTFSPNGVAHAFRE